MAIDINKASEGIDYEMVPSAELMEAEQSWDIRVMSGIFIESVIRFGNISIDGPKGQITFNFTVISSPIEDLTPENIDLQNKCGDILHSVLEDAISRDEVLLSERTKN
jgi:hypothetical protein|tara:strand:+ start:301 stop:624 length:324 start_codon:yes stop_codon:yes gene_type:complete